MNWNEAYTLIRPALERNKRAYKNLSAISLILGLVFLVVIWPLGVFLILLCIVFYIYYKTMSRTVSYVLTGICLKKETLEHELGSHTEIGDVAPIITFYTIRFNVHESFELTNQGKGNAIAKNIGMLRNINVHQLVYQACQKDKVISFVMSPDRDMIAFVMDGNLIQFKKQTPMETSISSKYYFSGDKTRVIESIEF